MLEIFATANDPLDHKEEVFGGVSLTGDDVVAVKPHGNPWKRGKSTLQGFVVTKRFKKIYRGIYGAKNLLAISRALPRKVMSDLPPKADMCGATKDVRFGPKADIADETRALHRVATR